MNILVRGNESNIAEFSAKFNDTIKFSTDSQYDIAIDLSIYDAIFDFTISEFPENIEQYAQQKDLALFANTVMTSLAEVSYLAQRPIQCNLIGFNGLSTFFNRSILEVAILEKAAGDICKDLSERIGFEFVIVEDRVGMVTPRVICMIINEAYYTTMEGTATKEDIDLAMKLGTNYPFGPFEWALNIGVENVFELLEALYEDTKDDRYRICPLLKKEYLLG